jgi:hypothetical protein
MSRFVLLFRSYVTRSDHVPGECAALTLVLLSSSMSTQLYALLALNQIVSVHYGRRFVFDHVIYLMLPKSVCVLFRINFRTFMLLFYIFVTSIS